MTRFIKRIARASVGRHAFVFLTLVLVAFLSTWFAFRQQTFVASRDCVFHLARFETVYASLAQHRLPPAVNFYTFGHVGSPVTGMYPWVSALIFVIPRFLGCSPVTALQAGFFLMNFLTVCFAYVMMRRVTRKTGVKMFGALLYQCNHYHFALMYSRFALGEALGYMAMPLVFSGLLSIWQTRQRGWILLGTGMAIIANAHFLSLLMTIVVVAGIVLARIVSRRISFREIVMLAKATTLSLVLSSYSLYNSWSIARHNKLLMPNEIYHVFYPIELSKYWDNTLKNTIMEGTSPSIGLVATLCLFLASFLVVKQCMQAARPWLLASVVMFASLCSFCLWPELVNSPASMIQFSMRGLVFVIICLVIGLGVASNSVCPPKMVLTSVCLLMVATVCRSVHDYNVFWEQKSRTNPDNRWVIVSDRNYHDMMADYTSDDYRVNNNFPVHNFDFRLPESNSRLGRYLAQDSQRVDKITVAGYYTDGVDYIRNTAQQQTLTLPCRCYNGVTYHVTINNHMVTYSNDAGYVKITVPKGQNVIRVRV